MDFIYDILVELGHFVGIIVANWKLVLVGFIVLLVIAVISKRR